MMPHHQLQVESSEHLAVQQVNYNFLKDEFYGGSNAGKLFAVPPALKTGMKQNFKQ